MSLHPTPRRVIKRELSWYAAAAAAVAVFITGTGGAMAQSMSARAVVVSKSNCRFDTTNLVLDFGTIDPGSASDATASVGGTVTCNGGPSSTVTLAFSLGSGTYSTGAGARSMRHATDVTEFLPYALGITPSSATIGKNGSLAFTLNGTIAPSQFQNVMAGSYADRVTISVAP